jgi:hypothetical protein
MCQSRIKIHQREKKPEIALNNYLVYMVKRILFCERTHTAVIAHAIHER